MSKRFIFLVLAISSVSMARANDAPVQNGQSENAAKASLSESPKPQSGSEYDGVKVDPTAPLPKRGMGEAARIAIHENLIIRPFTHDLFGLNYDWRSTESVLFDSAGGGWNTDAATRLFKGVRFPLNRMAGTDSQHFRWKQAIGPFGDRQNQRLMSWQKADPMRLGVVEFVSFLEQLDPKVRFVWVPNLVDDSAEDTADLAEFFGGDGKSNPNGGENWARKRIGLGLPNRIDVAVWEIGNEMDWDKNPWPVQKYVDTARRTIHAIRSVDPHARVALHAKTAPWGASKESWRAWHQAILKQLGPEIDYLAFHPYYCGLPIHMIEGYLDSIRDDIVGITGSDRIKILISEHARWPEKPVEGPWKKNWYKTHSLEGCLDTATFLLRCLNRPEVAAANYHSFSSGPWGLVYRDSKSRQLYTTGMAETFRLFGELRGKSVVKYEADGPYTDPSRDDFSLAVAVIKGEGTIDLLIVNRGAERPVSLKFESDYRVKEWNELTAPGMDSYNTVESKPIVLEKRPLPETVQGLTIPARSLNLIRLTVASSDAR